jgi:hypothetical protein
MTRLAASPQASLDAVTPKALPARLQCSAELLNRIRGEFHEMPGLSLTLAQACRLFGLCEAECAHALQELTSAGLLCRRHDGRYVVSLTAA